MGPYVPRHNKWPGSRLQREIRQGDRVRMIRRFAHQGRTHDEWDTRFGVPGDIGDVVAADHPDYLRVRWPNGTDPSWASYVDRDCVELYDGPTDEELAEQQRQREARRERLRVAIEEQERQLRNMESATRRSSVTFNYYFPSYSAGTHAGASTTAWIDDDANEELDWWEE